MPSLEVELSRLSDADRQAMATIVALATLYPDALAGAANERPDDLLKVLWKLFDLLRQQGGGRA
jgi:hypothetical protein